MLEAKKLELLEKYIQELIDENQATPVIVEGDADKFALRNLGLSGEILVLNSGFPLSVFVENVVKNYKRVILLLDWDRKGFNLTVKIVKFFQANDVVVMLAFWDRIRELVSKDIKDVESLPSLITRLNEKTRNIDT
ncbi:MAG: toprim domain-containing protein [Thermoplasmata archaeon]